MARNSHNTPDDITLVRGKNTVTASGMALSQSPDLLPQHSHELTVESGLTPETIKLAGIYSCEDAGQIAALLSRQYTNRKHLPALVYPYKSQWGQPLYSRVKFDNPATDDKGKVKGKYLSPSGSKPHPYFPPGFFKDIEDKTTTIFITEGEKKSLKLSQEGFPCIGLIGVEGWHQPRTITLLTELKDVVQGRDVVVIFDSDALTKQAVSDNESLLAAALQRQGCSVRIARLPDGENGEKVGADDFLVANPPAELHKLINTAEEPEPIRNAVSSSGKDARYEDPSELADTVIRTFTTGDACKVIRWNGSFWRWIKGCYVELSTDEMESFISNTLESNYSNVRNGAISNVMTKVKARTIVSSRRTSPSWIGKPPVKGWKPLDCLATRSHLVHLPSVEKPFSEYAVKATPCFFTTTATSFTFKSREETSKPERWHSFLEEVFSGDDEAIASLQQWFGYCLTHDTSLQKILLVIGPPRCGKGTIARVLCSLLGGSENVASPTLASLSTNFGSSALLGKSLAIVADARFSGRNMSDITERLLSISGEDRQTIDRKHKEPLTVKLPTRFMIMSNELPRLSDASGALASRFIVLEIHTSFLGKEQHDLDDELQRELNGILWWSIDGWLELKTRGHLLQPKSGNEAVEELLHLSSPYKKFIEERCELTDPEDGCWTRTDAIYEAFKDFWKSEGGGHTPLKETMAKSLRAAAPSITRVRKYQNGQRVPGYEGIRLISEF